MNSLRSLYATVPHTIILAQPVSKQTRTFYDYESVDDAVEGERLQRRYAQHIIEHSLSDHAALIRSGILRLLEQELRARFPNQRSVAYNLDDIYAFLDQFTDFSALT